MDSSLDLIFEKIDNYYLKMILGSHKYTEDYFRDRGTPLSPLPFPSSIWRLGTGENRSFIRQEIGSEEVISLALVKEYGIPIPPPMARGFKICSNLWFKIQRKIRDVIIEG